MFTETLRCTTNDIRFLATLKSNADWRKIQDAQDVAHEAAEGSQMRDLA
jgi:hypothetical protein